MFNSLKIFLQWANNLNIKVNFTVTKLCGEFSVTACTQLTLYQQLLLGKTKNFL